MLKGCIIIEGGGFRGLYAAGVLDALMKENMYFDTTVGVSAGVICGISYVSHQPGRTHEANLVLRKMPGYVGLGAYRKTGGMINVEIPLCNKEALEQFPLDEKQFNDPSSKFYAVVTNARTGRAEYIEHLEVENFVELVKATTALPLIQPMEKFDHHCYMDGGVADPVPFEWALKQGFQKVVVILTRPLEYRKKPYTHTWMRMLKIKYQHFPHLIEALERQIDNYNAERERLAQAEKEGKVFVIQPSHVIDISRMEGDLKKLDDWMNLGESDMNSRMEELKNYVSTS